MRIREPSSPREPRRIGELIEQIAAGRGWGARLALGRLRKMWPQVAGEAVAARSEPVGLEAGVLTIRAESGPWATELSLLSARLVERADRALGGGFVTAVRVVGGGAPARRPKS